MDERTLALLEQLIARPSVTPDDAGCLELIGQRLAAAGFALERMDSGPDSFRVANLWAVRRGREAEGPVLVFAGHTDVVPPAISPSGAATHSSPRCATAVCTGAARRT